MRTLVRVFVFIAAVALTTSAAVAQQRVHAVSGVVTAIHPKVRMIEIDTDDGSSGHFDCAKAGTPIEFDKSLSAGATAADKFETSNAHVIVYYFGQGDVRTAVGVFPLGEGQLKTSKGTVVKFNRHDRVLVIKNEAGAEQTFALAANTVADTETGVAPGFKADFPKGKTVRVTALQGSGTDTALLISHVME
jgi:hypothetical protein